MAAYSPLIGAELHAAVLRMFGEQVLPVQEADCLLRIWAEGNPEELQRMAAEGTLLEALQAQRPRLEAARDQRLSNSHLGMAELLEAAGVSLRL